MRLEPSLLLAGIPKPGQGEPLLPGPMETELAPRSLATLDVRLTKQCRNALAPVEFLTQRREIATVRTPGFAAIPLWESQNFWLSLKLASHNFAKIVSAYN